MPPLPLDPQAAPDHPQRSLPFKFRRKNFLGPQPSHSSSYSDVSYAYSDASASSSPVASSAVLETSEPNSPTDYAHIRAHSSPRRDYYYTFAASAEHEHEHDPDLFSWSVSGHLQAHSKHPLPDSRSPPSSSYSYSYRTSSPPLSPVLSSSHLSSSLLGQSYYHRPSTSTLSDSRPYTTEERKAVGSDDYEFDADLSEDEPDPYFSSPSHRRRISFSTSCERDRPIDRPPPQPQPVVRRMCPQAKQKSSGSHHRRADIPLSDVDNVHVSRRSRPVTPSVSSRQHSMQPPSSPLSRKSASVQRDLAHTRSSSRSYAEDEPSSSPLTAYPSSPIRSSAPVFKVPTSPVTRTLYSPLPPSSPLPSSPVSAPSSATAVESPLPQSSPLLPEVHVSEDEMDTSEAMHPASAHDHESLSQSEASSLSPAPPAVRSTSLLAILNPAPEPVLRSSSLGLLVASSSSFVRSSRSPTPPASEISPLRPCTPMRSTPEPDTSLALPSSSPLSPVLSIDATPQAHALAVATLQEDHDHRSTPSSPLSIPATPLFLPHPDPAGDDEEMHSVLSSPLSVASIVKDDKEGLSVDKEQRREASVPRELERREVEAPSEKEDKQERVTEKKVKKKRGKRVVSPVYVEDASDAEEQIAVPHAKTSNRSRLQVQIKAKGKEKRSPRVVYSDLESEEDAAVTDDKVHTSQAPAPLTSIKAANNATSGDDEVEEHDEDLNPQKTKSRGRGRKRKTDADASAEAKKRKKSRSSAPPSDNDGAAQPSRPRKRKRPLPTTQQPSVLPSPPCSPSKKLTSAQLTERRAAIQTRCPLDVAEVEGMLIEALGSARASSLAVESIWAAVGRARPGLDGMTLIRKAAVEGGDGDRVVGEDEEETVLGKKEWLSIVQDVLEYGRLTCGVFGRVESSFKDEHAHPLPPHYFYVPENDPDPDRAAIIKSIMPRPAKRSETKKYKQYYWKPLGKVSRWESEDTM